MATRTTAGTRPQFQEARPPVRDLGGHGSLPATGFGHSTVWKVLRRAGLSRPARPALEPANRYEWPCPGDLLHMDTSEYDRFRRPGHRLTGDRSSQDRRHRDGVDFVHAIVDDHSRLAYAEIHPDERAATVPASSSAWQQRDIDALRRSSRRCATTASP